MPRVCRSRFSGQTPMARDRRWDENGDGLRMDPCKRTRQATCEEDKMSVFGSIMSKIFGHGSAETPGVTSAVPSGAQPSGSAAGTASGTATSGTATTGTATSGAATTGTATAGTATTGTATGKPISRAEVEAMIGKIAAGKGEQYNWRQSIVDLMKLLDLDCSLNARKQLAQELGYTGALNGSAEMNIWLHQQVMTKLAESGGKVPESLRHA